MAARATALITGASSGIGAELARIFAANDHDLVLVARRAERLEALRDELARHPVDITVLSHNLALRNAPFTLRKTLAERDLKVDVLVNNAGVAYAGAFSAMDPEAVSRMVMLNAATLATLTRLLLPDMLARGRGRILNVASLAAFQAVPAMALYAATKAFVLSLSEALAEELRGSGVTVTALCPGFTATDMVQTINHDGTLFDVPRFLQSDVREVAQQGYDACMAAETVRIPGIANQMSALWTQMQPRALVRTLSGMFGRQLLRH